MANNTVLNAGSGGDTLRDIDKAGVKTPVVTIDLGGSGAESLIAGAMPASQSGSWTVTANAGTGTMAVSAASLPLPTGAATAAKQPAPGTAGSASSDVVTIQGIASMTAVKVDGSAVTQPVSGTVTANAGTNLNTSALALESGGNLATIAAAIFAEDAASANADRGIQVLAVRKGTPANTSGTDGDYEPLQVSAGRLWASATIDAALPAGTNAIGKLAANDGVDVGDVTVNNGSGLSAVCIQDGGNSITVDGTVTANAGTGSFAVAQATAGNLNATVVGTGTFATQATLQAGTALVGKVSASPETGTVYNGTTALTPKFAAISTASSGNTTVVAAVTSKKIRVLSYRFQSDADVSVKFRDNTAGVDLTGAMATGAKGGGGGASFSPAGHFETAAGDALSINLSGAVQVSGHLTYLEV